MLRTIPVSIFVCALLLMFVVPKPLLASSASWIATTSNDLNTGTNWNGGTAPGVGQDTYYDSTVSGINTTPSSSLDFSVSSLNFPNSANAFNFTFNNCSLTLDDVGIAGTETNTSISLLNSNHATALTGSQLNFSSMSNSSSGSATVNFTNTATVSDSSSGVTLSAMDVDQMIVSQAFEIFNEGQLIGSNVGIDNTTGTGGNLISTIDFYQLEFDGTVTAGDNVTIELLNDGTNGSSGSGNRVAVCGEGQIYASNTFQSGDGLDLSTTNSGNDSSTGVGGGWTGRLGSDQIFLGNAFQTGSNTTIAAINNGTYSQSFIAPNRTSGSDVGFLNGCQLNVGGVSGEAFHALDMLTIEMQNVGNDSSQGSGGNNVGFSAQAQMQFSGLFSVGDHATISSRNKGTYSGSNTGMSNSVGFHGDVQLFVNGIFQAQDFMNMTITNEGVNSGSGVANNRVGYVDDNQLELSVCTLGSHASLTFSNQGTSSSSAPSANTGYINGDQVYVSKPFSVGSFTADDHLRIDISNNGTSSSSTNNSYTGVLARNQIFMNVPFTAGENLTINASNIGTDSSTSAGGNQTGVVSFNQLNFLDTFIVGNEASLVVSNNGTCSITGTSSASGNSVGIVGGCQFTVENAFQAGDSLYLNIQNSGNDGNQGVGGDYLGYCGTAQILLNGTVNTVGSHATIYVSNRGTYTGSNSVNGNIIAFLGNSQVNISSFQAVDDLNMTVINEGVDQGSGLGSNSAGFIANNQLGFGTLTVGNNATIMVSNSGTSNTNSLTSFTGCVSGDQFSVNGAFQAGKNLKITASNSATNPGEASNVGTVSSQLNFGNNFTVDDGAVLSASNNGSGVVSGSQINFVQGFNLLSGKATFHATNHGTINGGYGISVGDGLGGNVNIILNNTSLHVDTTLTTFTIGQLNGDSTSVVQVKPQLIISTDSSVNADFSGTIQNFPLSVSSLLKRGPGTQKLSGSNAFTGLTTIQEGALVVTGSLAGGLTVNPSGTLKGTGQIFGDVVNTGKVAPGESIGTLYFLSNYYNNNGEYDVEVNGEGASDLISISGIANLNGGLVVVSSVDGTYKFYDRYTIVTAGNVYGTFSGTTALSALIHPVLTYDPQHVYLTLLSDIEHAAETDNQIAVAVQLDGIVSPNTQQALLMNQMVSLTLEDARDALDSLSGYQHASDYVTTQLIHRQFIRRLYDPLRSIVTTEPNCCCNTCCDDFGVWMDVGGSYIHANRNTNAAGFHANGHNITGGLQKTFCCDWTVGVAGAYEKDHLHFEKSGGWEHGNTWLVGLYGLYRPSCYYGLVDFTYGNSFNKLCRPINVGTLHYHAESRPSTSQYTFYGEAGFDYPVCNVLIQPFFGLEIGSYWRSHVTETDLGGWGLIIQKRNRFLSLARIGMHLTMEGLVSNGLDISLDLAWNIRLSSGKNTINTQFEDFGTPFEIRGVSFNSNSIDYALTVSAPFCDHWRVYVEGFGEAWNRINVFNFLAGLEFCW